MERLRAIGGSRNLNIWRWQDESFPNTLQDNRLIEAARYHQLIVVDTLRRFTSGLEENSSKDMETVTRGLRELTRFGAAVIAIHHAKKNSDNGTYRGSTELGAGVDITMNVEKSTGADQTIKLGSDKTRFPEELKLTLRVERAANHPVFHDASEDARAAEKAALDADLDRLKQLISELEPKAGQRPNQTQIVTEARSQGLGSRNTILDRLHQGEGSRWQSEPDGKSRVYKPIVQLSTSPAPGGPGDLDNGQGNLADPTDGENPAAGEEEAEVDGGQTQSVHVSTHSDTMGMNRLDNGDDEAAAGALAGTSDN